jgi:hypothetical protein
MTERGAPMTPAGFRKFLSRLAIGTKFQFLAIPTCCGLRAVTSWPMTAAPRHASGCITPPIICVGSKP